MVPVALAMIGGIVAGRYLPLPAGLLGLLAAAGLAVAIVTFRREHLHIATAVAIAAAIFAMSAVYAQLRYHSVEADDLVMFSGRSPIMATVRGQIVTSPMLAEDEAGFAPYRRPARTHFLVRCSRIKSPRPATTSAPATESWLPCSGMARVTVREPAPALRAGQDVELIGTLARVEGPDNPGQADWLEQARLDGVMSRISVPAAEGAVVLSGQTRSWLEQAFWNVRASVRQHLAGCGQPEDGRLLNALLTGDRHPALASLNQAMMRSGTAHFLSISGQHLAIFLGFVYLVCRLVSLTPRRAAILVLGLLIAYLLLAEPNAPLFRSAIMAGCLCLGTIFSRRYSALNAVAAATVVVLAFDPLQVFSAGFQLSFGIVAGMIVLHKPMRAMLFGRWLQRRGLMVFRERQAFGRWLYFAAADFGILMVVSSVNASLVSVPLVAYHFGLLSPYAPVLSILLSPVVTAVLVPGYLSMALAWPMPNLSAALGSFSAKAADLLSALINAADHLPGLCLNLQPVGVAWVLVFFAIIAAGLLVRPMLWRLPATGALTMVWIGLTVWTQTSAPAPGWAQMDVLAVGDGQCVVLRTPQGSTYLLDAGTRSPIDVANQILLPYLRHERLPVPRQVWLSHGDSDHYNALPPLLERCSLDSCYVGSSFGKDLAGAAERSGIDNLLASLTAGRVPIHPLSSGQVFQLDARTKLEVLWPPLEGKRSSNDSSLVLKITCDDRSVLLTGDLEVDGQTELAALPACRADVLLLPHHGHYRPTLPALVERVNPAFVIASMGHAMRPPAGQPQAGEFLGKLQRGRAFFATARNGQVRVTFGRGCLKVESMR